jgi:hypothetical protein
MRHLLSLLRMCGSLYLKQGSSVKVEKEVATYKIAAYVTAEEAAAKLTKEGLTVVGTYKGDAGTTVLYTKCANESRWLTNRLGDLQQ